MGKYSDLLLNTAAPETAGPGKYSSALLGTETKETPQARSSEGWGEWAVNSIRGRQDPKESATGTVFEQFRNELTNPTANAAIAGADDAAMADIIQKNLGDKFVRREQDVNGNVIMVTRGQGGQEQRGYVNKPGLDTQDVARSVYGLLPYAATGGATGVALKGAGLGVHMLGQAAASGVTSLAGDAAAMTQGSEQGLDVGKAGVMAGFGAAGPVLGAGAGALWRRFVTIPGLVDKGTGQLTAKGLEAARKAGLDPADLPPDFARAFARSVAETGDPAQAATRVGANHFNIPATRGQITKDPYFLTQEEAMRRRLMGETAQDTMSAFDRRQADALKEAALGGTQPTSTPNIAQTINPGRQAAFESERMGSTLGESIQGGLQEAQKGARTALSDAWKGTQDLAATPQALSELPDTISKSLSGETRFTPTAEKMASLIGDFVQGKSPVSEIGGVKLAPVQSVDQMRRGLLSLLKSSADPEDARMAGMVYDAYNSWVGESARKAMLAGDPAAAMKIVQARGFTKEVKGIFEPKDATGKTLPAARRIGKALEQADSGEGVINALMGSQGSRGVTDGTVQALKNVKQALDRWEPQSGKQAWDDIRLAYWTRLVTGRNGEMLGPQAMVNNIKGAMQGQSSVVSTLYSPKEVAEIRRFMMAVGRVAYKPPNASGSGYTAASLFKDGLMRVLESFGLGRAASATLNYTGVGNAWNAATARSAISQSVRPVRPNLTPIVTGAGQAYEQSQSGSR